MGWGGGPGYCWKEGAYGNLTGEQQAQMEALHKKHYEETARIRDDLRDRSGELNALLDTADPDTEKVRALQREISDLRSKLDQARVDFQLEARKIAPDARMGQGYGRGYGKGYGRGGWHHGRGHHRGGYGPGSCWN
jgi:zinc resistance-associated protein